MQYTNNRSSSNNQVNSSKLEELIEYAFSSYESENLSAARDFCYKIIQLDDTSFNGHHLLAVIEAQEENYGKAFYHFEEALKYGESPDIYYNLAWISHLCKKQEKLLKYSSKLLELSPDDPRGYRLLSRYYKQDHKKAIKHAQKALELAPDDKKSQILMYRALVRNGGYLEVIKTLEEKLSLQTNKDKELLFFLARQYLQSDTYAPDKSHDFFIKADKLLTSLSLDENKKQSSKAENLLARLAEIRGESEEIVEQHLSRALKLLPNDYHNALALSFSLLKQKKWQEGFKLYDTRRYLPAMQIMMNQYSSVPLINLSQDLKGETPLADMNIVVLSEQGIGDTLQFIRFAPLLKKKLGARYVAVHVPQTLKTLASSIEDVDLIVSDGDNLSNINAIVPMMSLPAVLDISAKDFLDPSVIMSKGYLTPQPKDDSISLTCLAEYPFKVGIVWQGNKMFDNDTKRSIPFEMLKPLFSTPLCTFFSLQVPSSDNFIELTQSYPNLVDLSPHLDDFNDTSIIMRQLDLLISVDTSTLHLAGAMGVKTWALVPSISDWRWHNDEDNSCWYDSVAIFRAKKGWNSLIEEVRERLKDMVGRIGSISDDTPAPSNENQLHQEILTLIEAEDWNKARSKIETLSMLYKDKDKDKDQAHVHNYLGVILAQQQEIDKAIKVFREGLSLYKSSSPPSLSPEQARVFVMLTTNICGLLAYEKQTEKAWKYMKNAISKDFLDNSILYLAVTMFYSNSALLSLLKEKRRKFRNNFSIKQSIAVCLINQASIENIEDAASILQAIDNEVLSNKISLPWEQDVLWSQIAVGYLGRNNAEKAQESFQKAYSIDPDKPENMTNHTATLALVGDSRQAISIYKKYLAKSKETHPDILAEFCSLLINNNRKDNAAKIAHDAIKKFPQHHKLQKIISILHT